MRYALLLGLLLALAPSAASARHQPCADRAPRTARIHGRDTQHYVDHWGRPAMRVTYRPGAYHFPVPYGAGYPYPHVGFVPVDSARYRARYYPGPPEHVRRW